MNYHVDWAPQSDGINRVTTPYFPHHPARIHRREDAGSMPFPTADRHVMMT